MINYFVYDGVNSRDFDVYISGTNVMNAPQRSIERVTVPGRNGTLTIDNGRFENVELTYPAFIVRNLFDNTDSLRNHLLKSAGYRRLEDTYNPDIFMLARYVDGLSFVPTQTLWEANFNIVFDRMPQRFLKTGELQQEFTASGSIMNPTNFDAKPMLRVYGTGALGIGSDTVTISSNPGYIDIDCSMMDAYHGATNCNDKITLSSGNFPVLKPGSNGITLANTITKVIITPNWWIL